MAFTVFKAEVLVEPAPDDRILIFAGAVGEALLDDGTKINVVASGKTLEITIGKKRYWADITPIVDEALKRYRENETNV